MYRWHVCKSRTIYLRETERERKGKAVWSFFLFLMTILPPLVFVLYKLLCLSLSPHLCLVPSISLSLHFLFLFNTPRAAAAAAAEAETPSCSLPSPPNSSLVLSNWVAEVCLISCLTHLHFPMLIQSKRSTHTHTPTPTFSTRLKRQAISFLPISFMCHLLSYNFLFLFHSLCFSLTRQTHFPHSFIPSLSPLCFLFSFLHSISPLLFIVSVVSVVYVLSFDESP